MFKQLLEKVKESIFSVLPVFCIVVLLHITGICRLDTWTFIMFIIGSIMLTIGLSFFSLGADLSLLKIGEQVGNYLASKRKVWLLLLMGFLIGVIITVAEPDLLVLAGQFQMPSIILIVAVGVGVGIFLAFSLLRIILQIDLSKVLTILYVITFFIAFIISQIKPDFLAIAFDSGGVTTGPMTVPFILALGLGVAHARGGKKAEDDSFGLVALCSIGPILSVLILGFFADASGDSSSTTTSVTNFLEMLKFSSDVIFDKLKEIIIAMSGIFVFIIIFEFAIIKNKFKKFLKSFLGLIYVFIGLTIFLAGAEIGFMQVGTEIGKHFANENLKYWLIPIGMVIGFLVVMAEPSVHVLNKQVEEITAGAISRKVMLFTLSIGVAISVGLSFARIIFEINMLYILIPGYLIAIILSLFAPKIFVAIAFDSGGVASGPMTATFLLPMAIGFVTEACTSLNFDSNKIVEYSFGTVALVAMTPLIVIQILGIIYRIITPIRSKNAERTPQPVIEFDIDITPWISVGE